jgi:phenylpyruvate tautomerase PptA (4-oxalocrotonate tautomerase family)
MPYLKIQTNQSLDESTQNALLKKASATVSAQLGKPLDYVMVAIDPPRPMMFAGSDEPTAYLELKSIGLSSANTTDFSAALCKLVAGELSIDKNRIYIEFSNSERSMWGWNGATF